MSQVSGTAPHAAPTGTIGASQSGATSAAPAPAPIPSPAPSPVPPANSVRGADGQESSAQENAPTNLSATPSTSFSDLLAKSEWGTWQFGANLNFELPLPLENGGLPQNRLTTREAAVYAHGLIDGVYETYLNFRAHDDTGSFLFEMREGWVQTHLDDSHHHGVKVGKFALTIDQVNTLRPFERPFITSPYTQSTFFAKDQEVDTGLEYHWQQPLSASSTFNLFAGLTSGYCYGNCTPLNNGERPLIPVYYAHPNIELRWGESKSITGFTYLGYKDVDATSTQLMALDELWTSGRLESGFFHQPKWMILSELFFRSKSPSALPTQNQEGGFLLFGRAINARLAANLRIELFTEPSLRDNDGDKRSNLTQGVAPFVSYSVSPHTQLRGQYSWSQTAQSGSNTEIGQAFAFQFVANLGDADVR